MHTPDLIYGNLFKDVQTNGIFEDSKTFVDLVPKYAPNYTLTEYERLKKKAKL